MSEIKDCPACKSDDVSSTFHGAAMRFVVCNVCGVRGPVEGDSEAAERGWNDICRDPLQPPTKIEEHIGHIYAATLDRKFCDLDELLIESALLLNRFRTFSKAIPPLIDEVREVAIIIRETSSPTSIIATDVFERLRKIERTLMEWTGEIEPSESES